MDETTLTVAVAAFHDRGTAARAAADLQKHGFHQKQIGVISQGPQGKVRRNADVVGRDHLKGALLGLISGAVIGAAAGLGLAYYQGTSLVNFSAAGAIIGAVLGLLLGAVTGMGMRKRDPSWYSKQFESGQSVVTVMADRRHEEAWDILRRNGGFEVANRILPEASAGAAEVAASDADLAGRRTSWESWPAPEPVPAPATEPASRPAVPAGETHLGEEPPPPPPPSSM